jgi:RNA polymerase sigma-70 factor (ECF subfamily)
VTTSLDDTRLAADVAYIFRVAYRLTGDVADAEDLVQDVCERALRKGPEFAVAQDCRRWLLRVLFNRFIDGRRHRQRSPIVVSDARCETEAALSIDVPGPEDLAVQSDSERALTRAWEKLEPAQQILLLLRAEGHQLGEIAQITEIDKPALSSRLHRARSSLAKYLEEERAAQLLCATSEKVR